eukprot:gene11501-2092_t
MLGDGTLPACIGATRPVFCLRRQGVSSGVLWAVVPTPGLAPDGWAQSLACIVNDAYSRGEDGMWRGRAERTSTSDVLLRLAAEKLIVLVRCDRSAPDHGQGGTNGGGGAGTSVLPAGGTGAGPVVVGCIHCDYSAEQAPSGPQGEFGLLAVDGGELRKGLGSFLVAAAEAYARSKGCCTMRCHIYSPRDKAVACAGHKAFLDQWYKVCGYERDPAGLGDLFATVFLHETPHEIVAQLAVECQFLRYVKSL